MTIELVTVVVCGVLAGGLWYGLRHADVSRLASAILVAAFLFILLAGLMSLALIAAGAVK